MRNLKKVLSLTLALVMLLGMMVVGAGAAEYADSGEIEYKEAAEVMSAIGVFNGTDGNKFDPQGNLTRAQAAKIITYMVLGQAVADKLPNTGSKFSDCPDGEWYVGSVNYLSDTGIVAGQGDGTFNPNGNVTGTEFAKMLLGILGYNAVTEKFVNDPSWAANIAVKARQAGLDADMTTQTVNSKALNRDQASQMAFNTLKGTMVYYVGGMDVTTSDGTTITIGGQATPVANETGKDYADRVWAGSLTTEDNMQFCEQYYPTLKLTTTDDHDELGRPVSKWELDKEEIVVSTKNPVATFTTEMKEKDIFKELGANGISGAYARYVVMDEIWENGVQVAGFQRIGTSDQFEADPSFGANGYDATVIIAKGDESNAAGFGNGISVEIYETDEANHYVMVIVKSTVAKVTNVVTTKDKTTYTIGGVGYADFLDEKDDDKIVLYGDVAKGDYVTYAVVKGVAHVWPTTKVTGTQTSKTNKNVITVDGEQYTIGTGVAGVASGDFTNSKVEADYYIDRLGFAVKTDSVASTDYAYITNVAPKKVDDIDGAKLSVQVRAVLSDGTVGVYDLDVEKKSTGDWVLTGTSEVLVTATNFANDALTGVGTALGTHNKIFGYSLEDGVISLEPLTALPTNTNNAANDTVYFAALGNMVKKGTTKYDVNTDKDVLADRDTTFVIYNAEKKTTTVVTGAANLPKAIDDENGGNGGTGYAVLQTGTTANVGTASVVFVYTASGVAAETSDDYVYVDATDWSLSGDKYSYSYIRPDGTEGVSEPGSKLGTNSKADSGVYVLKSDGTIDKTRPSKTQYVNSAYSNSLTTSGSTLVGANGSWYNLVDDTQIIYVDTGIGSLAGNDGYVVLKVENGTVTKDVATIFVVKAGDGASNPSRTVTAPAAKTDAGTSVVTTMTAASATKNVGDSGVIYTVTLSGTATKTNRYEITLTGLTGISVADDTTAPSNWSATVSDNKVIVNVTSAAAVSGAIKISGTVSGNVSATIGDGVQTFAVNGITTPVDVTSSSVTTGAGTSGAAQFTVEADKTLAAAGDEVTLTATLDVAVPVGKKVTVTFTDPSGKTIEIAAGQTSGTVKFTMGSSAVTTAATAAEASA